MTNDCQGIFISGEFETVHDEIICNMNFFETTLPVVHHNALPLFNQLETESSLDISISQLQQAPFEMSISSSTLQAYCSTVLPGLPLLDVVSLLSRNCIHTGIREAAVVHLSSMNITEHIELLMFFVQFEHFADNSLLRLLLNFALDNLVQFGEKMYWMAHSLGYFAFCELLLNSHEAFREKISSSKYLKSQLSTFKGSKEFTQVTFETQVFVPTLPHAFNSLMFSVLDKHNEEILCKIIEPKGRFLYFQFQKSVNAQIQLVYTWLERFIYSILDHDHVQLASTVWLDGNRVSNI